MMRQNIKYMISMALVLLFAQGAWADPVVTVIKTLDGAAVTTTSPGEVASEIADGKCTLTVTPTIGYLVTKDNITAYSVVTGNVAQAPKRRSPNMDNDPIEVTNAADNTDPTGETKYELTMPADGSDVEVTVDFQSYQLYGLRIGGVEVSEYNFEDVLKDGKVSFDVENNILTLNGATINGGIHSELEDGLTVHLLGENTIDAQESYAFVSGITTSYLPLEFTTNESTPGQLLIKNGSFSSGSYQYQSHFSPSFKNGLTFDDDADKWLIDVAPAMTPGEGLYWPDQQFTVSGKIGDDLYYKNNLNSTEQKYTAPFTLTAGKYSLSAVRKVVKEETTFSISGQSNTYFVHNKPGFSVAAGTHTGTQNVTLTNLPADLSAAEEGYPQVWYYLGENSNDSVRITTAEQEIAVTESTKVCVYIIDEDSDKIVKSDTVQAQYVILSSPNLHFGSVGGSYFDNGDKQYANFGQEFEAPLVKTVDSNHQSSTDLTGLTITYSSSDPTVATISATTGVLSIVGGGVTTIKAKSAQTDVYAADSAWYQLEVKPIAPQLSLQKGIYEPGKKVALIPTVDNGKMYYRIGTGDYTEYTDSIALSAGTNKISVKTVCGTVESYESERFFWAYPKPQFSLSDGTYDGPQDVTITNVYTDDNEFIGQALYYKIGNDSTVYHEGDVITIGETTTVCAYYCVRESDDYISDPVEAHYVIRQDAGLQYLLNDEPVEVAEYTIGGAESQLLPTLQNEHGLTVTYSSEATDVATVNATTGEVTPVGVGVTSIIASWNATATLMAGQATYLLHVFKDLSHESITVTVDNATYTGEGVEPEVTVMDGETDITEYVSVAYSNNVEPGTNATVTITPNAELDVNYYVGSTTETFTIAYRTLTIGEDVTFASGQKWASYYNVEESLNLPEGVMAYIVTAVSETSATVKAINYVPVEEPVFLYKDDSVTPTDNSSAAGNLLVGIAEDTPVSELDGPVYGLYNNKLMRVTTGTIPAGRAVLASEAAVARQLSLVFEMGDFTGIRLTENGQLTIDDGVWYTIDGRKLQQKPAKSGLYIKNGKTVVVNNK